MDRFLGMPRTMADDILLIAQGPRALAQFHTAFSSTIQHLQDMGSNIASSKSLLVATTSKHRNWLAFSCGLRLGMLYEWSTIFAT